MESVLGHLTSEQLAWVLQNPAKYAQYLAQVDGAAYTQWTLLLAARPHYLEDYARGLAAGPAAATPGPSPPALEPPAADLHSAASSRCVCLRPQLTVLVVERAASLSPVRSGALAPAVTTSTDAPAAAALQLSAPPAALGSNDVQWSIAPGLELAFEDEGGGLLTEQAVKKQKRMQSNRESARRSRQRKAEEVQLMADTVRAHEAEIARWQAHVRLLNRHLRSLAAQVRGSEGASCACVQSRCRLTYMTHRAGPEARRHRQPRHAERRAATCWHDRGGEQC